MASRTIETMHATMPIDLACLLSACGFCHHHSFQYFSISCLKMKSFHNCIALSFSCNIFTFSYVNLFLPLPLLSLSLSLSLFSHFSHWSFNYFLSQPTNWFFPEDTEMWRLHVALLICKMTLFWNHAKYVRHYIFYLIAFVRISILILKCSIY